MATRKEKETRFLNKDFVESEPIYVINDAGQKVIPSSFFRREEKVADIISKSANYQDLSVLDGVKPGIIRSLDGKGDFAYDPTSHVLNEVVPGFHAASGRNGRAR